jgi:uncharacterized protein (DUF1684 family)
MAKKNTNKLPPLAPELLEINRTVRLYKKCPSATAWLAVERAMLAYQIKYFRTDDISTFFDFEDTTHVS